MFLNLDCVFTCLVRLHLTFYWREVLIHNLMEELRFLQGNVLKNTSNSLFPRNLGSLSACFLHSKMFAQTTKYVCTFLFIIFFSFKSVPEKCSQSSSNGQMEPPSVLQAPWKWYCREKEHAPSKVDTTTCSPRRWKLGKLASACLVQDLQQQLLTGRK